MREIVLDTETTGLDPYDGHRIVEIACVELLNRIPTGTHFHVYIDPERDMPDEAFRVHGLSREFLAQHRCFAEVWEEFLDFIGDASLVIHNAAFDVGFLNAELERVGARLIGRERIVDTLLLARRKQPGAMNSLDALCQRYGIDLSRRVKHGALLDAELLAEVYLELLGGRQSALVLDVMGRGEERAEMRVVRVRPVALASRLAAEEVAAHRAFIGTLGENALWRDYLKEEAAAA